MPTPTFSLVYPAIEALLTHYRQRARTTDALGMELSGILAACPDYDAAHAILATSQHPIVAVLENTVHRHPGALHGILDLLQPVLAALPWRYGYTARADCPDLNQRLAWAELIGPLAPWRSHRICLGLTAISPHTRYPEHAHPAVETYLVLDGHAHWRIGHEEMTVGPGNFILHPGGAVHAMETGDTPLLAAYTWSGDLDSPSVYPA
ncbi:cupin domain-containing protein [Alcaligenaceae bacterium SJ-26]|nr:cupin domain-containing protein [Alcaligenaceae bacterium SJ-26]